MSQEPNRFTIRVYGLLFHQGKVLLSRENIIGEVHTKFPGGGLEYGEGLKDCVERELKEEASIEVTATELFYLTEDFVKSSFHQKKQVISIYYRLQASKDELGKISTGDPSNSSLLENNGDQVLYWCATSELHRQSIELPIDKKVIEKILSEHT